MAVGRHVSTIGGISLGSAGSGVTAGLTMVAGDDFNAQPTLWSGRNTTGNYSHSGPGKPNRRLNGATSTANVFLDSDYYGARNESLTAVASSPHSVSSSILSQTASLTPGGLTTYLPAAFAAPGGDASSFPQLVSGSLCTWPSFAFSAAGDFVYEALVQWPSADTRGLWSSVWTSTYTNWPDYGETDMFEMFNQTGPAKKYDGNFNISTSDGAGDTVTGLVNQQTVPTNRFVWMLLKKSGTTLTIYDDTAVQGTLASIGTYTNARVGRLKGAHEIRIQNPFDTAHGLTPFNTTNIPAVFQVDWWRCWTPTGQGLNTPLNVIQTINTTAGGAWTASVPSDVSMFGAAVDLVEYCAAFDNWDAPGLTLDPSTYTATSNYQASGMTVDLGARTIAGTVPAGSGGKIGVLFTGTFTAGGPARRAIIYFNVAPVNISLFVNQTIGINSALSLSIAYADFHSGNLPHTYTVTCDQGWVTITGSGTTSVTLTGTSPGSGQVANVTVNCLNSAGQTTTVAKTITVSAAWQPSNWTTLVSYWDPTDASTVFSNIAGTVPSVVGSDVIGNIKDKKGAANLSFPNTAGINKPTYITDGITSKSAIKFTAASSQVLANLNDAGITAVVNGDDKPYTIVAAVRRGAAGVSVTPFALTSNSATNNFVRHFIGGTNALGVNRQIAGTATQANEAVGSFTTDVWSVVTICFAGTTVILRKDGVQVFSGALNAASMTLAGLGLGGTYSSSTSTWSLFFNGALGVVMISSDASVTSDVSSAEVWVKAQSGVP